jgi:hypothetical protein
MQSKGRGLFWGILMSLMELFQDAASPIAAVQGQYLLQGQHFAAGDAVTECSTTLRSAVIRASELIKAGYVIEIWSPTSLESQLPGPLPA